jgi:hypothetical protein
VSCGAALSCAQTAYAIGFGVVYGVCAVGCSAMGLIACKVSRFVIGHRVLQYSTTALALAASVILWFYLNLAHSDSIRDSPLVRHA